MQSLIGRFLEMMMPLDTNRRPENQMLSDGSSHPSTSAPRSPQYLNRTRPNSRNITHLSMEPVRAPSDPSLQDHTRQGGFTVRG